MNNTMYQILMLVISLIGVLLTGLIVPWLKLKIGNEKIKDIELWVSVAVAAAEQMKVAGLLPYGQEKKTYVLQFIRDKGITITDEELDALIESAVYEINRAKGMLLYTDDKQKV